MSHRRSCSTSASTCWWSGSCSWCSRPSATRSRRPPTAIAPGVADDDRARRHRGRPVRLWHVPAPPTTSHSHPHRTRSTCPRRQPPDHSVGGRTGPAHVHWLWRVGVASRSTATGLRAHRDRHHLRRHRLPARPGVPQLGADPRRRGAGRRRGPPRRPAHRGGRRRGRPGGRGRDRRADERQRVRGRGGRCRARGQAVTALLALPIALPLGAAALSVVVGRWRVAQQVIGLVTLTALLGTSIALLVAVDRDGGEATQAGGWPAPFGITLVADRLAAVMLVVAMVMLLAVLVYAVGQGGEERRHVGFHPVYLGLTAGGGAAPPSRAPVYFFLSFLVRFTASHSLLTLGGRRDQVRSGMTYVVISLVASALFLTAVAFVYAATGTVNLADLSVKLADLPVGVRQALGLLLLVVFGIKAAVFPLFFWLPDSYPTAPTAVTAVFAGLLTKVGVYAIVRTQTVLLSAGDRPQVLLLGIAGATMLVGVLGAIAPNDIKRILSFQIVSGIGFMVMGLGLLTVAGLAGAGFMILHPPVPMTSLFLSGGLVEHRAGTGHLDRLGGLVRTAPALAVLFLISALSLAGVPPLPGFVAKFALVDAGIDVGSWGVVAVSLLVSLLTLFSMTKIWSGAFWGRVEPAVGVQQRVPLSMLAPTVVLVVLSLALVVFAGPLYGISERAAADLLDRTTYVRVVLGG